MQGSDSVVMNGDWFLGGARGEGDMAERGQTDEDTCRSVLLFGHSDTVCIASRTSLQMLMGEHPTHAGGTDISMTRT